MLYMMSFIIIFISMYYSYKNPMIFLIIYGIVASPYEGYGILHMFSSGNSYYGFIMNLLLLSATFFSFIKRNLIHKNDLKIVCLSLGLLLEIFFVLWVGLFCGKNEGVFISFLSNIVYISPIYLIILLQSKRRYNINKYFINYLRIQIFISFLVIYLPIVNVHILDIISSVNYMDESVAHLCNKDTALLNNFYYVFIDKYTFNQTAQFHNPNSVGFYGGTGLFVFSYLLYKNRLKEIFNIIINIICIFMSLAIWCNSGMKGPVFGIIIGIILYVGWDKNQIVRSIKVFYLVILILILGYLMSYLFDLSYFENSFRISISGRKTLRESGFEFILNNLFLGNFGTFEGLKNIDPHELPVRMTVLFGVLGGVLTIFIVYIIPLKNFWKKKRNIYKLVLFMIVVMVSLTNNYTCIVLFYFILVIAAYNFNVEKENINEKNIIY